MRHLSSTPLDVAQILTSVWPAPLGYRLRYAFWKNRLKFIGNDVRIDTGVFFQKPKYISLANGCWIDRSVIILAGPPRKDRIIYQKTNEDFKLNTGDVYIGQYTHVAPFCVLSGIGGIHIGKNTGIASHSMIYSFSHHYRNLKNRSDRSQYSFTPLARKDQQAMISGPVVVADYCAVGLNSVILPGTSIGRGSWVSSGSLVSGNYPPQSLIFGGSNGGYKPIHSLTVKE